jgi:hypothetical protein
MRAAVFILMLLLGIKQLHAQTVISGMLNSKEDGKGLSGVNVSVKDKKTAATLAYAVTDAKGNYMLKFNSATDSLLLNLNGFNLARQLHVIAKRSATLDYAMAYEAIKLKEVKVNPPKIRKLNDTINYRVDGFKDQNDRTIGDVLKKMPGIEVKGDGSVLYNNKPINKFYIENKDLLQGRYGIATNNLEAKDVESVQVLENHQPVKALKNREFSDDAALNIKLKDNAKGVLVGNGKLGAGVSPLLWNNELYSMYFNKGRQNMNTYKGNNTGEDPSAELGLMYGANNTNNSGTSLAVQSPSNPSISQNRYLFNRAHALTINNMWSPGKDNQFNANFSYLDDRQDKGSFARSTYYLPGDSLLTIDERLNSREHVHQLEAAFLLNKNKDNYFLDNNLNFKGKWNQIDATVMNADTVYQDLKSPSVSISNNLSFIRNYKKSSLKLYSQLSYNRVPQNLSVQPVLYENLFSSIPNPVAMQQSLSQNQLTANNSATLGFTGTDFKQNYTFGMRLNRKNLNSTLGQQATNGNYNVAADSLRNDLNFNKVEFYMSPDYTYAINQLKLTMAIPVSYNYLATKDELSGRKITLDRLYLKPSFNFTYDYNLFLSIVGRVRIDRQLGDIANIFTGYIMQSYRSLIRNDGQLPEQRSQSYNLDLNYRHPLHSIFLNIGTAYNRTKANLLFGYEYQGILNLKKTYLIPNVLDNYSMYGRLSKGIDPIGGTLTLDASINLSNSVAISQDHLLDLRNISYQFRPGFNAKLKTWASMDYSFQYNHSKNEIRNESNNTSAIRSSVQRSRFFIYPVKGLTINFSHEYFYTNALSSGSRVMNFADAGIKYRQKNMEYGLGCSNIFNVKQYISAIYNSTNTYYAEYNLRPTQLLASVRFKIK